MAVNTGRAKIRYTFQRLVSLFPELGKYSSWAVAENAVTQTHGALLWVSPTGNPPPVSSSTPCALQGPGVTVFLQPPPKRGFCTFSSKSKFLRDKIRSDIWGCQDAAWGMGGSKPLTLRIS